MYQNKNFNLAIFITIFIVSSCSSVQPINKGQTISKDPLPAPSTPVVNNVLPMKVGEINFKFDSTAIEISELEEIDKTIDTLNDSPSNYYIRIIGHADEYGPETYNHKLGMARAEVIKQRLVFRGINQERIIVASHGEHHPLVTKINHDIQRRNRRAVIEIVPAAYSFPNTTISMNEKK